MFISGSSFPAGSGVLIDGLTMRRRTVSRPGCGASALGGPWLAFTCGTAPLLTYELYDIASGQFQPFTATEPYQDCMIDGDPIIAIGTDWVALEAVSDDEHTLPSFAFQNITSGKTTSDPTTASTNIDLNSSELVTNVCRPLSVPTVSDVYSSGRGSLTFDDGYAIVWQSAAGRVSGLFLPSRRRFMIAVPRNVDPSTGFANGDMYQLALTATRLYLVRQGLIWSIPAPVKPRSNRHHQG